MTNQKTVVCFISLVFLISFSDIALAQEHVSFPTQDGGTIYADVYGKGERAVVLAHGGSFNKESWAKQIPILVNAGYRVLALDFRGYGQSHGPGDRAVLSAPLYLDVLGAAEYLKIHGAKSVAAIGGSMGGGAAADASIVAPPGEFNCLVLLGAQPDKPAERIKAPLLIIVARDDTSGSGPRLPGIQAKFDRAPQPKELILLDGHAHAQYLFQTDQADRVMSEILRFLAKYSIP